MSKLKAADLVPVMTGSVSKKSGTGKKLFKAVLFFAAVGVGIKAVKTTVNKKKEELKRNNENSDIKEYFNVIGGEDIKVVDKEATDMKVKTYVGGVNIDLSKAIITKDINIELNTVAGGVNIIVPDGINVEEMYETKGAGTHNTTKKFEGAPTIYLCGKIIAGGVNIETKSEESCCSDNSNCCCDDTTSCCDDTSYCGEEKTSCDAE